MVAANALPAAQNKTKHRKLIHMRSWHRGHRRGVKKCSLLAWFTSLCAQLVQMLVQMCVQLAQMLGSSVLVEEL
jgi:hypothetical protein